MSHHTPFVRFYASRLENARFSTIFMPVNRHLHYIHMQANLVTYARGGLLLLMLSCWLYLPLVTFAQSPPTTGTPPVKPLQQNSATQNSATVAGVTNPAQMRIVNPQSREASLRFYEDYYLPGTTVTPEWSGDLSNCQAGEVTAAFRTAILQRINYFRAMAGVPATVTFADDYNRQAQQAALMMSANAQLSHDPPPDWRCYSEEGDTAAGSANLYLGVFGPAAIDGYIEDPGAGNFFVGHRRWILYPQTQLMGTGDIPNQGAQRAANALWVFDTEHMWGPRPATREAFVAWPPPGFVPAQFIFPRWSFAYPGADFSQTTVTVLSNGTNVPVQQAALGNGYGENTLVWEMPTLQAAHTATAPGTEASYATTVANVLVDGVMRSFTYSVIGFDPAVPSAPLVPVAYLPLIQNSAQ